MNQLHNFIVSQEVQDALQANRPVVALESSIISHGMPYPTNIETALLCEQTVRENGAVPATIGVFQGKVVVGLTKEQIIGLSNNPEDPTSKAMKASVKGIPYAVTNGLNAGFTIAAIMRTASMAGIRFMATGGIGGVAKGGELSMDISADLEEMGHTSVAVISAGCKSILDIGRTKEYLETKDVPVIGMGTDSFPAFFTPHSKYRIDYRIDDYEQVARFVYEKWAMGLPGAVILSNPVPEAYAMDEATIDSAIQEAVRLSVEQGIAGEKSTPFLLSKVCEITGGASLRANVEIVRNNARVAAIIAKHYCELNH